MYKLCSYVHGKWFEPKGISYLFSVIVRVRVVFTKTAVGDGRDLSGSHLQSQVKSSHLGSDGIYASGHSLEWSVLL